MSFSFFLACSRSKIGFVKRRSPLNPYEKNENAPSNNLASKACYSMKFYMKIHFTIGVVFHTLLGRQSAYIFHFEQYCENELQTDQKLKTSFHEKKLFHKILHVSKCHVWYLHYFLCLCVCVGRCYEDFTFLFMFLKSYFL